MSDKPYFCIHLDECACPAFCSFDKPYFGTIEDFEKIARKMKEHGIYEGTAAALEAFFNGEKKARHIIAYQDIPVLTPIDVIEIHKHRMDAFSWEHINIWGFPYKVKFKQAEITKATFFWEERYVVGIKVCWNNLAYGTQPDKWFPLNGRFWGNSCVFDISNYDEDGDYTVSTLPFFVIGQYESKEEAINKSKQQPVTENFNTICNDIFADG